MLIDTSYFAEGEVGVPNLGRTEEDERLQYFIDIMVPQFLIDLFGYPLAKPLMAELQAQEDASGSPASLSSRFDKLVNGTEYTGNDGQLRKWNGLIFVQGAVKRSPAANYVYWHWLRDKQKQVTGLGTQAAKSENSWLVSALSQLATVQQQMSRMVNELYYFMLCNYSADYPEWTSQARVTMLAFFKPSNQFGI